jgi:hypothetical protein
MALLKNTYGTESKSLQLRFETFNIWNHAQFQNPTGLINSSLFSMVTSANPPRVLQIAASFCSSRATDCTPARLRSC